MVKSKTKTKADVPKNDKINTKHQLNYEEIGRVLVNVSEYGYRNKRELYKMSFVKGVIAGVGGVFGATIVVGLVIFGLSLLSDVPVIGEIAEQVSESLEPGDPSTFTKPE